MPKFQGITQSDGHDLSAAGLVTSFFSFFQANIYYIIVFGLLYYFFNRKVLFKSNNSSKVNGSRTVLGKLKKSTIDSSLKKDNLNIAFLHPDLGIGGAERLVLDAGLAYKSKGHSVIFYTSHHDPAHCFPETKDGTFEVIVYGDWLPRNILGKFAALCAYVRMIYLALRVCLDLKNDYDVLFIDQISHCIPIVYILLPCKIIFYCHFPDQLLSVRRSFIKNLYRWPLDKAEELTIGMADLILVNSMFTKSVFGKTFSALKDSTDPKVLYPSINVTSFEIADSDLKKEYTKLVELIPSLNIVESTNVNVDGNGDENLSSEKEMAKILLLSVNRYERKKNVALCVEALIFLKNTLPKEQFDKLHLVIAGGYDPRVSENVEYYEELNQLCVEASIANKVTFLRSISQSMKIALLKRCNCLLYTPENEHFGIGPLEAMYMKKMVLARDSGGPLETVSTGASGILCDGVAANWAKAIQTYVLDSRKRKLMGETGFTRFNNLFSFEAFSAKLNEMTYSKS